MWRRILSLAVPITVALALADSTQAGEIVPYDQVPEKAAATIRHNLGPSYRLVTVEREREQGKPDIYIVTWIDPFGRRFLLKVSENGDVISKQGG